MARPILTYEDYIPNARKRIFAATLTANANVFGALTLIAESFATSTTTPPALFSKSRRMFAMFVPPQELQI